MQTMLSTGTFPDRLKFSEVKPIYKKGEKTFTTNYRPISLLTAFLKLFQKIIRKRLYHHLTLNNILVKEQFGFRCNNSTEIAIYALINNILSSVNNKMGYFVITRKLLTAQIKTYYCWKWNIMVHIRCC